jgi:hypothetical protein
MQHYQSKKYCLSMLTSNHPPISPTCFANSHYPVIRVPGTIKLRLFTSLKHV